MASMRRTFARSAAQAWRFIQRGMLPCSIRDVPPFHVLLKMFHMRPAAFFGRHTRHSGGGAGNATRPAICRESQQ